MAAKKVLDDGLSIEIQPEEKVDKTPRVSVYIPPAPEAEAGMKTDPYEHVTINGETYYVKRGERVDVPVPVFMQLRNRYPNI